MKKHYRGKRHMYARRTVAIGREKKRMNKLVRFLEFIKKENWKLSNKNAIAVVENYRKAMLGLW